MGAPCRRWDEAFQRLGGDSSAWTLTAQSKEAWQSTEQEFVHRMLRWRKHVLPPGRLMHDFQELVIHPDTGGSSLPP